MAAEAQRAPSVRERETVAPRFEAPDGSLAASHRKLQVQVDRCAVQVGHAFALTKLVSDALGSDPDTSEAAEAVQAIGTLLLFICNDLDAVAHSEAD
jgi:hypothetical protein